MPGSRTFLVTGGGGFLGRAIVERLVARGDRVRSLSRGDYPELAAMGVECVCADLGDADALRRACDGCDAVFHVAAKAGIWGSYASFYAANVVGTQNVIAACRSAGVKALIYTSSPSVVFDGGDMERVDESVPYPARYHAHYPRTKALAEQAVLAANSVSAADGVTRDAAARGSDGSDCKPDASPTGALATVALRPHLIWGPRDNHLVPRIIARASRLRRIGREDKLVDSTYIDNAADAHVLAAKRLLAVPLKTPLPSREGPGEGRNDANMSDAMSATADVQNRKLPVTAPLTSNQVNGVGLANPKSKIQNPKSPQSPAGRAYFISNGEPRPIWDLVNAILAAASLPPATRTIPRAAARAAGAAFEAVYTLFRLPAEPPMTRFLADELSTAHWFDISAAKRDFGYQPRVTIDEGLQRLAEWLAVEKGKPGS